MKHLVATLRLIFRPKRFTTIVMMLIIWTGVAGALFAAISSDLRNRDYLRGRAQIISNALPVSNIRDLKGNGADLTSLSYTQLKDRLQQIRASNHDLRFVYLVSLKNDSVVFLADSEIPGTSGYSPPGQIYTEASPQLRAAFNSTEPFVEGPNKDRYGVWISGLAPIIDPESGKVIAIAGIDTPATNYYAQIGLYALVPLLLAAIPFAGLLRDIKIQSKEQEMIQLKHQFVSIASHELRSPLAGMLWAIQSLSRSGAARMNLEQLSMLGAMYHSTESSLATVNEILDFSIFDRGQAKLQHEPVDIAAVIKQVVATLTLSAREKRLNIEPIGKWPRQVYTSGDVAALKRAYMNIFSNAIKYSHDNGSIEITHKMGINEHIIGIHDHGIGIPEEEKPKVMQGYYRATNATATVANGTGLGILVTRKVIEQHKGRVWIESTLGKGTTVYIALPAIQQSPKDSTPAANDSTAKPNHADSQNKASNTPVETDQPTNPGPAETTTVVSTPLAPDPNQQPQTDAVSSAQPESAGSMPQAQDLPLTDKL